MRSTTLSNGVAPALVFSPWIPGIVARADQRVMPMPALPEVARPADLEDAAFWSIAELAALLRKTDVSSVELTEMYLDRLRRLDEELHCVITFTRERALESAARADALFASGTDLGLLHGIPWGVKDLMACEGYRTTWGAKPFEAQILDETAEVIERLDAAGAVLVAKLSVGALAWGDVWFGERTRSPWDTTRGSSGSSAGSASAAAAGGVAFAIGTETLGSIVSPSVACSTSALRPTFGRVSRQGTMALCWSMDKIGPITRTLDDAAIVFDAIEGRDPEDAFSRDGRVPTGAATLAEAGSLTIGAPAGASGARNRCRGSATSWRPWGIRSSRSSSRASCGGHAPHARGGGRDGLRRVHPQRPRRRADPAGAQRVAQRLPRGALRTRRRVPARAAPALARDGRARPRPPGRGRHRPRALRSRGAAAHQPHGPSDSRRPLRSRGGSRQDGSPYTVCFTGHLDCDEELLSIARSWQNAHPEHVRRPPWTGSRRAPRAPGERRAGGSPRGAVVHGGALGGGEPERHRQRGGLDPPRGNALVGTFRQVRRDRDTAFVELSQIAVEDGAVILRLRHLHGRLEVPESRAKVSVFELVSIAEDRVEFRGTAEAMRVTSVVYERVDPVTLVQSIGFDPFTGEKPFVTRYRLDDGPDSVRGAGAREGK